ncbi:unnamed protein product [Caenorhabditis nigoni]
MTHAFWISVIFSCFLFSSGASSNYQNCGIISLREDFKCILKLVNFNDELSKINLKPSAKYLRGLWNSCEYLETCYSNLECKKNDVDVRRIARNMKSFCYKLNQLRNF